MKVKILLTKLFVLLLFINVLGQTRHATKSKFMSYKGLVMAGYQGWFNCEGDGADRGWTHYSKGGVFEDGSCTIDYWPEMDEYKVKYKTPFKFADGSPAYVFSSFDESTVDLHFRWMKEYGIDGVFMQRFFSVLTSENRINHNDKVLASAIKAANKYGVAISLMYDIGSMDDSKYKLVMEDWKHLVDDLKLTNQGKKTTYLFHNEKPLVAFWGISSSGREHGHIPEIFDIMDFFKNDPVYGGCSIHLGIPSRWRTLGSDTRKDPRLHEVIKQADVVHPWLVGRYNEKTYEKYRQENIIDDVIWCKEHGKSYAPTVFPGFSWYNMKPNEISDKIPKNKGEFYWKQIAGAIESGAEMLYVAMFDEIDEGTAIMKCAHKVPVGKSIFVPIEKEVPSDHYLWLTKMAGKMLRGEIPFSKKMPERN
ncbi:MAG: xylosidase [Prolixibacteraceae bacterium]|jgi:glycoprotein endo-alpha-1,2-mannosidase|nr:xylosidase [Prolixibacteraceae bacterium]MBT6765134.1 xylosidase [Prolixibacteraceae bacterium]MBT7000884.1 xylosidase [Prolixibacteraceae bacterium]MBT7397163.1 xylosidase [Prolixibacteraceae bacterium]